MDTGLLQFIGGIVILVVLITFFCMGHYLSVIRQNTRIISTQLDQFLKASGIQDPLKDRTEAASKASAGSSR